MKTLTTVLGNVEINDVRIVRASGYGQYSIKINIEFEGQNKELSLHTTDSQLFDEANSEDNHSEIVMDGAKTSIENEIENYINSL